MTQVTSPNSPLRQRMLDDMRMRKLAPKTQSAYLRAVQRLAGFLGRAPSRVTAEELRQFHLSCRAALTNGRGERWTGSLCL